NGPSTAQNVVVTDTLPPQVKYVSTSIQTGQSWQCSYASTSRTVTCQLTSLGVSKSVSLPILVQVVDKSKPFTNCATVHASTFDPNPSNNNACLTLNQNLQPVAAAAPTVADASPSGGSWLDQLGAWIRNLMAWLSPPQQISKR